MSNKYTIEVSITPVCPSCGEDMEVGMTVSRPSNQPIERDNPYERKDRRVFVTPCAKCYEYKGR